VAVYFFDTSTLIKRYILEPGSNWTRGIYASHIVVISALALTEVSSVFARRNREGTHSTIDRNALLRAFHNNVAQYVLVDIDRTLPNSAGATLINAPAPLALRSLDAIHLAYAQSFAANSAASGLGPLTFVSADTRLLAAAQWAGFPTDDPNNHP